MVAWGHLPLAWGHPPSPGMGTPGMGTPTLALLGFGTGTLAWTVEQSVGQWVSPKTDDPALLTHTELDDSPVARQAFGRGLCVVDGGLIAAGSSPSTITLHDLDSLQTTLSINLSMDIRNAVHGLEVCPFDNPP